MKRLFSILAAITLSIAAFAQNEKITWTEHVELQEGNEYRVIFTGKIANGYHTYTLTDKDSPTEFWEMTVTGGELVGKPYEIGKPIEEMYDGELAKHYYNEIIVAQNVKLTSPTPRRRRSRRASTRRLSRRLPKRLAPMCSTIRPNGMSARLPTALRYRIPR